MTPKEARKWLQIRELLVGLSDCEDAYHAVYRVATEGNFGLREPWARLEKLAATDGGENMELRSCPFCGGSVRFHQDDEDCPSGCHNIICTGCKAFIDLSSYADPKNEADTLDELHAKIALKWNYRTYFASDAAGDAK